MLRCMHIRKLQACGWIKVPTNKLKNIPDSEASKGDLSYSTNWSNLKPVDNKTILPFTIASFDIECTSEDGNFPQHQRNGDKVIQIGTTISRYGEAECFYKHITTLGTCDDILGVDVVPCKSEAEVLMRWVEMINKMNPDIITGYNIFGFDFEYLYERAKKLGIEIAFSQLGRINGQKCVFVKKDLSSSALGDNKLKYYDIDGRIIVDLMKVIQRDFKLESYKLDNVASYFIRESFKPTDMEVLDERSVIKTYNANSIKAGHYISINYNDGLTDNKFEEGKKYHVAEVPDNFTIILEEKMVDSEDLFSKPYKFFWCQAKDDVSPQEIFALQEGSSKDRARVAKYCVQDCALCNRLMDKLQVITNNIGMANVCNIPLTYLFLRGQGVKIFSLVSKKCQELGYVIPVIQKKFNRNDFHQQKFEKAINDNIYPKKIKGMDEAEDDEDDEDGYEGATVFTPDVGVHFGPIPVLDYASLYPSSMIHRNLSHEMLLEEETMLQYREIYERLSKMDEVTINVHAKTFRKEVEIFDMIKTVDYLNVAKEIDKRCKNISKIMPILVEVNSGKEENKDGCMPENVESLIKEISKLKNLKIKGLMTMAPFFDNPEKDRPFFRLTKRLFDKIKGLNIPNVDMEILSMGMTDSYKIAIEEGSNMIRIGTKIFGPRQ